MRHRPYDDLELSPGVDPMVDPDWLHEHRHDLDGWVPTIEVTQPGSKYTVRIKDTSRLSEISKIIMRRE